jgi:hypothetical protein
MEYTNTTCESVILHIRLRLGNLELLNIAKNMSFGGKKNAVLIFSFIIYNLFGPGCNC